MDFLSLDGFERVIVVDYCTKKLFNRKIPPSQYNSAKTIAVLKKLFIEHRIAEVIRLDNGPQFTSFPFAKFLRNGTLTITHLHHRIRGAIIRQNLQSRLSRDCPPMLNTLDRTPASPCWLTGVHQIQLLCLSATCITAHPLYIPCIFITVHNSSCRKVMFSQVSVCPQGEEYNHWQTPPSLHPPGQIAPPGVQPPPARHHPTGQTPPADTPW